MKTKLIMMAIALTALSVYLSAAKTNTVATSTYSPARIIEKVKASLPLPRLLNKQSTAQDYSNYAEEEVKEEIKKTETLLTDAETLAELNAGKSSSVKREEVERLMEKRNALLDHLLGMKVQAITAKVDSTLDTQRGVIKNTLSDQEKE